MMILKIITLKTYFTLDYVPRQASFWVAPAFVSGLRDWLFDCKGQINMNLEFLLLRRNGQTEYSAAVQ